MLKHGVFSGLHFPVFSPNMGKYGPQKTLYLDTFYAVRPDKKEHLFYTTVPPILQILFSEEVTQRCSMKKVFWKFFTKFTEKHLRQCFFFIKKETLTQVFSWEFWEIFKITFFYRTRLVAASEQTEIFKLSMFTLAILVLEL